MESFSTLLRRGKFCRMMSVIRMKIVTIISGNFR